MIRFFSFLTFAFLLVSCMGKGRNSVITGFDESETKTSSSTSGTSLIDNSNSSIGFGGGTKMGVQWNTNSTDKLILGPDTDCDGDMNEGETVYTNCSELDASWTPQWASLLSYWKMNNNWNDVKGGNNATPVGDATFTSSSKVGPTAATFDGFGDYATLNSPIVAGADMTYSAWIYTSAVGGQTPFGEDGAGVCYIMMFGGGSMWVGNCAGNTQVNWPFDDSISLGKWAYLVLTKSSNTLELYVNGISQGTRGLAGISNVQHLASGQGHRDINGRLDDVAIWNVALSASEIQTIYARQSAKYAGQLTSRVMDYGSLKAWSGLKWLTTLPFGKELTGDANNSGTITAADSESSSVYSSLVGSNGSTSDDNLMSGLVGLWHLNETADTAGANNDFNDASGRAHHGEKVGALTYTSNGRFGGSPNLNGGYISVPYSADFNTDELSISVWINPASIGNDISFVNTEGCNGGENNGFGLRQRADGTVWIQIGCNGAGTNARSTSAMKPLTWYHIVATYSKTSGDLKLYMDSIAEGSTAGLNNVIDSTANLAMGAWSSGSMEFKGYMDEVAIWSRALHADEVKQLYRRGANRIKYQVRTCTAADCSDNPTWLGNDNSQGSYFSELHNYAPYNFDTNNCAATNLILTGSPSLLFSCFSGALSNLTSQRYFQYRSILESDDTTTNCNYGGGATWCSPELKSVEAKP